MKKTFLSLVVAFTAITLSLALTTPFITAAHAQQIPFGTFPDNIPRISPDDPDFTVIGDDIYVRGQYTVLLNNETFASIDNNPKFSDEKKFKMSSLPQDKAQIVPELKHEYAVSVGTIVNEKVEQYNGTRGSSLSPLKIQDAQVKDVYIHAIRGFSVEDVEDISVFVGDPDIAAVEPVRVKFLDLQYNSYNAYRIGALQMPATIVQRNNIESFLDVDILVADTAVLASHPDLVFMGPHKNYLPTGYTANINNLGAALDHGTKVAGIAAARDNLAGVAGAAPGAKVWSAIICGIRTSDNLVVCPGNEITMFNDAIAGGGVIDVINMSYGSACPTGGVCNNDITAAEQTAINNLETAGIMAVKSAGNSRADVDGGNTFCDATTVLCVSAMGDTDGKCGGLGPTWTSSSGSTTQRDDARAYFSNFGDNVDIMAMGTNTDTPRLVVSLSTSPPSEEAGHSTAGINAALPFIGASIHGSYHNFGGTSEAAPWVAGAAAALKALHPTWTPSQIRTDLISNAIPQNAPCNSSTGIGGLANGINSGSDEPILNLAAID